MNNIEHDYLKLLKDILDNGVEKSDRTGTGTVSIFGRQIRHDMSLGFPLLTTKKMPFKTITTELLWFLRGDTNIKFLVDNNCHIWDGDAYKNYTSTTEHPLSIMEFIDTIKNDSLRARTLGELGPIYGKQWRNWNAIFDGGIDQITNLIRDLKTNPDSRRLMVSAWNVGELDQMVLPPCHYGFQVYTRELSWYDDLDKIKEIYVNWSLAKSSGGYAGDIKADTIESANQIFVNGWQNNKDPYTGKPLIELECFSSIPKRAISLMWNQRSVDTFLGLPFNIASYGLLLEIIAKAVNMVPDELIGNLGDVHLYSNHIEQAKEQLTRQPHPLPALNINTEWWPTESRECGIGPIDAVAVFNGFSNESFCKCLLEEDIQLSNYESHPSIKAPLSN